MPPEATALDFFIRNFKDELAKRISMATEALKGCTLCPRQCQVDRTLGNTGFCGTGKLARVAAAHLHFGEEEELVGSGGSGTIFFSGCNLGCLFCQNRDISRTPASGQEVTSRELAGIMLALQEQGAENINLVTPSHVVSQILECLPLAHAMGLRIPLVYNTSAYDRVETLRLLDGLVDIYLPDAKVWDPETAGSILGAADYPDIARQALREMSLQMAPRPGHSPGDAPPGLIIRHLVLPGGLAGTPHWLEFFRHALSSSLRLNIMGQYRPCGPACSHPTLGRAVTPGEFRQMRDMARNMDFSLCSP